MTLLPRRVSYFYVRVRSASDDPKVDVVAVARDWKKLGVTTERYQTGGDDSILGVRGRRGPVSSSDFQADPRGYTIDTRSRCDLGDYNKMNRDSAE